MAEPTTEAGRAMLGTLTAIKPDAPRTIATAIAIVEQEAIKDERKRLAGLVNAKRVTPLNVRDETAARIDSYNRALEFVLDLLASQDVPASVIDDL